MKPILHVLHLKNVPIFRQLQIEEALLRANNDNWFLYNEGSLPAIVMGISGQPDVLLNRDLLQQAPLPVIRRFSGGGTVVVDEDTLFATFICSKETTQVCGCPVEIHRWVEDLYKKIFPENFRLRENDYVFGDKKFGGNAQYIRKDRWLHHSTLLWVINPKLMEYLLHPPKAPKYRQNRHHLDFLCQLQDFLSDRKAFLTRLMVVLQENWKICETSLERVESILDQPHRKSTFLL